MHRSSAVLIGALTLAACGGEDDGNATMRPGEDCLACHSAGEAPRFTAAGTVYPRGDAAAGAGLAGATVTLTGSRSGQVVTLTTNSAGNFHTGAPLTPPIAVTIASGGHTASMTAAPSGACAACHHPGVGAGTPPRVHVGACTSCH
jgi:hypothetical protein